MKLNIIVAFRNSTYTEYVIKTLSEEGHIVHKAMYVDDILFPKHDERYDLAMIDIDFEADDRGLSLIRRCRSSQDWRSKLVIMAAIDSNYRDDMPPIDDEQFEMFDYLMILPRYLLSLVPDIKEAMRIAAIKRQ